MSSRNLILPYAFQMGPACPNAHWSHFWSDFPGHHVCDRIQDSFGRRECVADIRNTTVLDWSERDRAIVAKIKFEEHCDEWHAIRRRVCDAEYKVSAARTSWITAPILPWEQQAHDEAQAELSHARFLKRQIAEEVEAAILAACEAYEGHSVSP